MHLTSGEGGRRNPLEVNIVAYEGFKLMDAAGALQAFRDARFSDGSPAYRVALVSETGGFVTSDTGIRLETTPLLDAVHRQTDTILIAGTDLTGAVTGTESLRKQLAQRLDRPRRLGSICTGAFILAELGVLDGHEATTHWAFCQRLQSDFPAVIVKPDAIFVTSGRIWTSAGVSAGIDMALAMIHDDLGHKAALDVARGMVLFLKRPGGQSQFSVELQRQMHDERDRFHDLHAWIRINLDANLSVSTLADRAGMSPRNFARLYPRETGESPARAVEKIRIEAAVRLLESTDVPVKVIAHRTGFGDDERMRRAFIKAFDISPQDFRNRFGRMQS